MRALHLAALSLLLACAGDPAPDSGAADAAAEDLPTLTPPPDGEGFQMQMQPLVAEAYSETWACEVYSLPNSAYAPVNRVEYLQNEGTHHMTLSTVALSGHTLEDGVYDCEALYGDASLMEDQVMFFGNQGDGEGVMQLPEGVVADLPPNLQIIHEVHYVNATAEPVTLYNYLNAWTIDPDAVTDRIWGGQVRDETISVPAGAEVTEWTRCVMNQDVDVHFLAGHMHALGTRFTIAPFDGETTGDVFYDNDDWHNPKITQYEPPIALKAGEGFEYACTWLNTTDQDVTYGPTAQDEMCNMALVFTPMSTSALCEVVQSSDGAIWTP